MKVSEHGGLYQRRSGMNDVFKEEPTGSANAVM